MTNYSRGYYFEGTISTDLRGEGYYCIESRGSHGKIDVLAVKPGELLGIQAKSDGKISPDEWNGLIEVCAAYQMTPILACREKRKIAYYELTGVKVPYARNPPRVRWYADRVAA